MGFIYRGTEYTNDDARKKFSDTIVKIQLDGGSQYVAHIADFGNNRVQFRTVTIHPETGDLVWSEPITKPMNQVEIIQEVPEAGWYACSEERSYFIAIKPDRQWRFGSCPARIETSNPDWMDACAYAFLDNHVSIVQAIDNILRGGQQQSLSRHCILSRNKGMFLLDFLGYKTDVEIAGNFNIQPCTLIDEINEDLQNVNVV